MSLCFVLGFCIEVIDFFWLIMLLAIRRCREFVHMSVKGLIFHCNPTFTIINKMFYVKVKEFPFFVILV